MVFADIEGSPHIAHDGDAHDRRSETYQFAYLRVDIAYLALALSHLTVIYIKQSLGPLSALCGCVVASIGASSGIVYLMGGSYERACYAAKNMIAILTGMICDGAKPSCSLKISSGVSVAVLSATMAMEGRHVTAAEGIIDEDIDQCVRNLTHIGKDAMSATDTMILDIMTHKKH